MFKARDSTTRQRQLSVSACACRVIWRRSPNLRDRQNWRLYTTVYLSTFIHDVVARIESRFVIKMQHVLRTCSFVAIFLCIGTSWHVGKTSQIARFTCPTWGPPGSCRLQVSPMLAQWTLLSGVICLTTLDFAIRGILCGPLSPQCKCLLGIRIVKYNVRSSQFLLYILFCCEALFDK